MESPRNKYHKVLFIRLFGFGLVMLLAWACEERYFPEIDIKYDNLLVVEGQITNMPGPYFVKLSSSIPLETNLPVPLSGFQVTISDHLGNRETLMEKDPGSYETSANGIQGIAGRKYKLEISSPNGQNYSTDFEELREAVDIDSVYHQLEYIVDDDLPYDIAGYQFYVNTELPQADTNYFMWNLSSTYKYQSDFIIRWMYDGELHQFTNSDSLRTCWKTEVIKTIFISSTENLSPPGLAVEGAMLNYVSTAGRDLSIRYSLLTQQFTISKEAYTFWSQVKEQNQSNSELYSKQPYQLRGNVYSVDNTEEPVLGYFTVAGMAEKRIFVDRPKAPIKMRYPVCMLVEADYMNFGTIFLTLPSEWPQYATYNNNGGNAYPNQDCLNCQLRGGTIEKPEFWIDQ